MCRNVNNIHLCHMHGIPTSTCETPAIYTVCAYPTLRAMCFLSLLYMFFYTISMCVCVHMYICVRVCSCVSAASVHMCACCVCMCMCKLHSTSTTTYNHHQHIQQPLPHPPTTTSHNHHYQIQPPPPHCASNNRTTTCSSRVNVLVGSGKRPPAQVTEGQDHMCT